MNFDFAQIGIIILFLILVVYAIYAMYNSSVIRRKVADFLNELSEDLFDYIFNKMKNIDIRAFENAESYASYMMVQVYEFAWDFVEKKVKSVDPENPIYPLLMKYMDRDFVNKFVKKFITDKDLTMAFYNYYASCNIDDSKVEEIEFADQILNANFKLDESEDNEFIEDIEKDENFQYEEASEPVVSEEDEALLNPQQIIDFETYADDDSSVEEIKEYIEKKVNKAGRQVYYLVNEDGKKKQISKAVALESGLEIQDV